MTDLIILATLLAGPRHGYQLKQEAGLILGQQRLHNNLVYPLLRRFTERGWVTRKTVPGKRGQKRHLYALTALGRRTRIARLAEYREADAASREAFMTRVGLFHAPDAATRERILNSREAYLKKSAEHVAAIEERFSLGVYSQQTTQF